MSKLAHPETRSLGVRQLPMITRLPHTRLSTPRSDHYASRIERRLRVTTIAALFASLILSPHLWLSERVYPLTPVFRSLVTIPYPLDYILYAALLAILAVIAFVPRPTKWIGAAVALGLTLAAYDQSRWQPWFYQYLIMLVALALYHRKTGEIKDDHDAAFNTCRFLLACTYFWSGWQKVHTEFMAKSFRWLLEPITAWLPQSIAHTTLWFGYVAPFAEVGIGIGLLIPRFRKWAILLAFGMHAFILAAIGPLGRNYNTVVWPWNIAMCVLLWILYWDRPKVSTREIVWPARARFHRVVFVLFGVAPALSFFGLWDGYLSCALYAEARNLPTFYISHNMAMRFPREIKPYVYATKQSDIHTINIFEWSLTELNACAYPEPRIYKNIARHVCSYAQQDSDFKLVIMREQLLLSPAKEFSYTCADLADGSTHD